MPSHRLVLIRCHSLWVHWSRYSKVSRVSDYMCVRLFYANLFDDHFLYIRYVEWKTISEPILNSTQVFRLLRIFGEFENNSNFMDKYLFSRIPSYYWQKCQRIVCFVSLCVKAVDVLKNSVLEDWVSPFGPDSGVRALRRNIESNSWRRSVRSPALHSSSHVLQSLKTVDQILKMWSPTHVQVIGKTRFTSFSTKVRHILTDYLPNN